MPVRRRRTQRVAKRPEAARVLRVTDDGQWHKLLGKLGDRLLLIHFSAVRRATLRCPAVAMDVLFGAAKHDM